MKFSELNLEDSVLDALDAMNFRECTPVQEQTIPVILEGHDLIGVAQTGTGKTAAYLLPILNRLSKGGYPEDAINCIVMAPTRELAMQIDQQMEGFSYFMPVSSVAVYGGNDGIRFEQEKKRTYLGGRRSDSHTGTAYQPHQFGICRPFEGVFLHSRRSGQNARHGVLGRHHANREVFA